MRLTSILSASALALTAHTQAVVIDTIDMTDFLSSDAIQDQFSGSVLPLEIPGHGTVYLDAHTTDSEKIILNDGAIYPPVTTPTQVNALLVQDDESPKHVPLTLSVEYNRDEPEEGASLMTISVWGLGDEPVDPEDVVIRYEKSGDKISAVRISSSAHDVEFDEDCTDAMCRARTVLSSKMAGTLEALHSGVEKVKSGCRKAWNAITGSRPPFIANADDLAPLEIKPAHEFGRPPFKLHGGIDKYRGMVHMPHSQAPHDGPRIIGDKEEQSAGRLGHHHHHMGHMNGKPCGRKSWLMHVARGFLFAIHSIIVPVLIGIAAGLAVSSLAMLIGQVIGMAIVYFRRGGRRGQYERVNREDVVVEGVDEVIIVEEGLPRYEDLKEPLEVVDEKREDN